MNRSTVSKAIAPALLIGLASPLCFASSAGAQSTRTSGAGNSVDVSWTEYDPDDLLGLPGNVHIGYLYAYTGPYGSYVGGSVTDFDCDEGESPYGGHGGQGVEEVVVDEAADSARDAVQDSIDATIDSGASTIDATDVADAVQAQLSEDVPDVIHDEFEEIPACDYVQDRFLSGDGTATVTIDKRTRVARIVGTLTVSNGGHGETGTVLATPPVDVTIAGGDWEKYESSYSSRSASYKYSNWEKGTRFYGGAVTGGIGRMGFADDADDVSFGGFGYFRYTTVERIR
jgi:hypothetical protein